MMKLHHKKNSFTLVELVMTIVVVVIIAVPLSLFLSQHVRSVFQSEDLTMARNLARFEMEWVNNMDYASISNNSYSNYEGYSYDLTRTVTYAHGDAGSVESVKEITVEVVKSGDSAVLVKLITYIAKNVILNL